MHPTRLRADANRSERQLFTAFEGLQGRDDWVVMTGLTVGQHVAGLSGEVDAIVIAPGTGILSSRRRQLSMWSTATGSGFWRRIRGRRRTRSRSWMVRAAASAAS